MVEQKEEGYPAWAVFYSRARPSRSKPGSVNARARVLIPRIHQMFLEHTLKEKQTI